MLSACFYETIFCVTNDFAADLFFIFRHNIKKKINPNKNLRSKLVKNMLKIVRIEGTYRIAGTICNFPVILRMGFDTETDAEKYLTENGWMKKENGFEKILTELPVLQVPDGPDFMKKK